MEKSENKQVKILFMEARENLFGHVRINEWIINVLSKLGKVHIVFPRGWIKDIPDNVIIHEYETKKYPIKENAAQILKSLDCLRYAKKIDEKEHFDCIIFAAYNVYAMTIGRWMFKESKSRLFLIHHNILDQLELSSIKRFLFGTYEKSVNHIFIEKFIAGKFLEMRKIDRAQIYYFSHPLNKIDRDIVNDIDYLGISNSNDEDWVKYLIEEEEKSGKFRNEKIKIILRSTKYEFDNDFLTVFKGRLEDSEYYEMILRSRCILVPFPEDFKYRVSGSVVDAFSNHKRVLGSSIPIIVEYHKLYPGICKIGVAIDDIIKDFHFQKTYLNSQKEFEEFSKNHSLNIIVKEFSSIINKTSNMDD
jgi:hypothetical protein